MPNPHIQHYVQYAAVVAYRTVEATVIIMLELLKTVTAIDGYKINFVSNFTSIVNNLLHSSGSLNNVGIH